jgi:phage terminase small subunit
MRGRKPKPTVLKKLHHSTEPINPNEPRAEGDVRPDTAPAHFDDEQREAWAYALKHAPPGMLKMIDAGVLECWVVAHCYHRRAVKAQAVAGATLLVRTPHTRQMVQSPYLAIINRQALIMSKLAAELGFSPTARPRVGLTLGGEGLNGSTHGAEGHGQETIQQYLDRAPDTSAIH